MFSIWISMLLHLWFDDAHVDLREYGLLSAWRDARGVIIVIIYLSVAFALHLIHSSAYGVMPPLASCDRTDTTSFIGIMMRLHTLLGMKAGDTTFALHMHSNFGLWHDGLGLRLWMSSWEAMLFQGLLVINLYHGWSCINCWTHLIAYCWLTYKWGLNRCLLNL